MRDDPSVNPQRLTRHDMVTKPHAQISGQGFQTQGNDGFRHGFIQRGRQQAPVHHPLEAFVAFRRCPVRPDPPCRFRVIRDLEAGGIRQSADDTACVFHNVEAVFHGAHPSPLSVTSGDSSVR